MLVDDLNRAIVDHGEGGAQGFMAPQDFGDASLQYRHVEWTGEFDAHMYVVERALGLELIEEPDPLLGEGQWRWSGVGAAANSCRLRLRHPLLAQQRLEDRPLLSGEFQCRFVRATHRSSPRLLRRRHSSMSDPNAGGIG